MDKKRKAEDKKKRKAERKLASETAKMTAATSESEPTEDNSHDPDSADPTETA
jgi:hypothetical protein